MIYYTSFKAILENTRQKMAKKHLLSGLTASQTAYLLGFTEPSTFQRAFKRWFGVSPGEFKNETVRSVDAHDKAGQQDQNGHQ